MKLLPLLIVLLCVVPADGAQPKRCFNNVSGYCRKRCKLGEISEVGCLHAKYCCVNEQANKNYKVINQPEKPKKKSKEVQHYWVLPTVTYFTISI